MVCHWYAHWCPTDDGGAVTTPTIYFDLDGVLADFDSRAEEILGTDNIYKFEFVYGPEAFWKGINSNAHFFLGLRRMPGSDRLLQATWHYPRAILTALPKTNGDTVDRQKREWVREHFGKGMKVITCTTKDKPNYCLPGDILIDDRAVNKAAWEKAGGKYIIHMSVESTLEQLKSLGVVEPPKGDF